MQVFWSGVALTNPVSEQRLCLCSNEGTIEEKEKLQNETSEPERVKNTEYMGSERTEEIQHNKKIKTILSGEILRPLQRKRESFRRAVAMKNKHSE